MKSVEERIKESEKKLEEIRKKKEALKDKPKESIKELRQCVKELVEIDNIKNSYEEDPELYMDRARKIINSFHYLQDHQQNSLELQEAKELIKSIGKKHPKLENWCKELIKSETPKALALWDAEFNIDRNSEFIIEKDSKIVVDREKAKKIIDTEWYIGSKEYDNLQFEYKVIVKGKEYNHLYHLVNYSSECEKPENCPYRVELTSWKKNEKGERILIFNITEN